MGIFRKLGWAHRILLATWCALAIFLAWRGTFPNPYLLYVRRITAPQPYPFILVGIELLLSAIVFATAGWALAGRAWQRVWRAFLCGAVSGVIGVSAAIGAMHMPDHYVYFAWAMLAMSALCIVLGIAALAAAIIGK